MIGSNFQELIQKLADEISEMVNDYGEPLDGDETERFGRLLTLELDKRQGNVNEDEYLEELRRIEYLF